jgi:hypothetical protein
VDNAGSRGGEIERERVADCSLRPTRTRQMMTVTYIYVDIDISRLCLSLCPSAHVCSVCRIASVRMNLFCGGHVIYVGIARQDGTMRAYTPLSVFIRAYTPLVFMHLYSLSLSLSLSLSHILLLFLCETDASK